MGGYSVTPNGLTSTNYTITFAPGTLTVTPAPLTLTADAQSKLYGAAMPTIGVTPTGLVNGDVLGSLAGTLGETTTATSASDVGGYSVTPNGLTSTNYTITFAPGTLTVTPAPLTLTADAQSKLYGPRCRRSASRPPAW